MPYGHTGVNGWSKWRRLLGRPSLGCMYGVKVALKATEEWPWRQRVNERKIGKSGEPWYICNWKSFTRPFCFALCSFGPPYRALVVITCRGVRYRYMMRLGWTVKRAQLLKSKALMSSIWASECMLMMLCVLSDLTWLPILGGGRKSWYIIISIIKPQLHNILLR